MRDPAPLAQLLRVGASEESDALDAATVRRELARAILVGDIGVELIDDGPALAPSREVRRGSAAQSGMVGERVPDHANRRGSMTDWVVMSKDSAVRPW
jgi:hypothetical protein